MKKIVPLYEKMNNKYGSQYEATVHALIHNIEKISTLTSVTQDCHDYIRATMTLINQQYKLEKHLLNGYIRKHAFETLLQDNNDYFMELTGKDYETSYANPTYTAGVFGRETGQILSYVYGNIKGAYQDIFKHNRFALWKHYELFNLIVVAMGEGKDHKDFRKIVYDFKTAIREDEDHMNVAETFTSENQFFNDIINNADLTDLKYLFEYGQYITENEIKTAKFLMSYDKAKLDVLTNTIVEAYVMGFVRDNKDMSKRHNVRIASVLGQELMTQSIMSKLPAKNLSGFVYLADGTEFNKQFDYDFKFANALYLDEAYSEKSVALMEKAFKDNEKAVRDYSGILYVEKFGEEPFSPSSKEDRLKLSDDQLQIFNTQRTKASQISESYIPEEERSFCIVAFPTPEIGENFEAIFEEVLKINMLQSDEYEAIQKYLIDSLDRGEKVHVKGKDGNKTDIVVALQSLSNPEKETNFVNCVADVNIPVGEVFTSPVLKSTTGTLHVEDIYLDGFRYYNLEMDFEDGYIKDYTCTNFDDESKNKAYVKENLLLPHDTLPIGEFAIGTNTLAYTIAQKYDIMDKLPILIIEKMGPHFAIGDTCFSWAEDTPVFNSDGKEIIARDNERSILRKTDLNNAYTNKHTDITLPYSSLASINAITASGEIIPIIEDSRFVIPGTEMLNTHFED